MLGVGIPAASFYLNELFYYDADALLLNFGGRFALFLIWLGWAGVCLILVFLRWRTFHWFGLAPLVVILASGLFHYHADLWRNHNYAKFHETRLAFARQYQTADPTCAPVPSLLGPLEFPGDGDEPEVNETKNGTNVYYRTGEGSGFLYAPRLADPIVNLPNLYLEFAEIWDEEACVYWVVTR